MTPEMAIDIFKNVITFSLTVVSPFIGVMLLVGLVTSLIQSVTSIQEQTLTFAPKLIALALLCVVLGPWTIRSLTDFATRVFIQMGTMGH